MVLLCNLWCCMFVATTLLLSVAVVTARVADQEQGVPRRSKHRSTLRRSAKPNIVFIITDDQDSELGSMNYMPKTLRLLQDEGAHFHNAFVTTPMCCPSRSSMLTGMYVHNHNVYTNNANCSSLYWQHNYEVRNFGTYLTNAGYRTGYFGKYLNEYQGTYIPPGWTEWVGLIRNTRYYNYTLNFNGEHIKHFGDYHKDYLTDLIANDSVTFLKQSKQYFPNRPVAMVLSMPAPHGPEDAAPQHQHLFSNVTTHRTPSWNFAPNADKQWLLQHTGKMEPIHIAFTDMLQRKRLQTLQAVDDAVEKVYNELKSLGELDNTYLVFTSDHGYHLGQYGLIKGKALPYDFDIRVPFYIRGPNIPQGVRVPNIALNIDLAPTFLDIAGVDIPEHMDGRSLLRLFDEDMTYDTGNNLKRKKAWRDSFLVERGKVTQKKIKERARIEANNNPQQQLQTKEQRLEKNCQKAEFQSPCSAKQEWECKRKADGTLRMYKCRSRGVYELHPNDVTVTQRCDCSVSSLSKSEKRRQKQFLSDHVSQPNLFKPKFLHSRLRRDVDERTRRRFRRPRRTSGFTNNGEGAAICKVLADNTVVCSRSVYANRRRWRKQRQQVDDTIVELKNKLDTLREIKEHLKDARPEDSTPTAVSTLDDPRDIQETIPLDGLHQSDTNQNEAKLPLDPGSYSAYYGNSKSQLQVPRQNDQPGSIAVDQSDIGFGNDRLGRNGRRRKNRKPSRKLDDVFGDSSQDPATYDWPDVMKAELHDVLDAVQEPIRDSETDYDDEIFDDYSSELEEEFHPEDYEDFDDAEYVPDSLQHECLCDDGQVLSAHDLVKQEREERRRKRKEEIEEKKAQKKAEREKNRQEKRYNRGEKDEVTEINPTRDCHSGAMKCFEHSNDHWKTAPLWNMGPFCFCPNSNNNTYWCVRTINETHNFLYCEFITGFINYYDINKDPYQLRNAVRDLSYTTLHTLHNMLEKLKTCSGARECTTRTRQDKNVGNNPALEPITGSGEEDAGSGAFTGNDASRSLSDLTADQAGSGQKYEGGTNGHSSLDMDLEFSNHPIPYRASVVIETSGSGDDYSFSDIAADPRKELFLYWTNLYRLDTTFLEKSELDRIFRTDSKVDSKKTKSIAGSIESKRGQDSIADPDKIEKAAQNASAKDPRSKSNNFGSVSSEGDEGESNLDASGEAWNKINIFQQDQHFTQTVAKEQLDKEHIVKPPVLDKYQEDLPFAGPPINGAYPPVASQKSRHRTSRHKRGKPL